MNTRTVLHSSLVIVSVLASAACVSQGTCDRDLRDAAAARAEAEQAKADARQAIGVSAGVAEFQKQATELDEMRHTSLNNDAAADAVI